ncbi:TetR/AcrR family transcriptional regulator [Streptomyces sp. NPDC051985]|uniref:TetR/AcrR family transcriptional regulator n=1 Tax=Streptomyces sp. NPDC051985 TaxID=3155807 RepID=UPI0034314FCF
MRKVRKDAVRMRERLLDAAKELDQARGADFSLPELAQAAGVSTATVYRHFDNPEDVRTGYTTRSVDRLVTSLEALPEKHRGIELFNETCRVWLTATEPWARAAIRYRPSEGYLERRAAGRPLIVRLDASLRFVLKALVELDIVPPQDLSAATLVWITLFDERVLIDLTEAAGWSLDQVIDHLSVTLLMSLGAHREVARRIVSTPR